MKILFYRYGSICEDDILSCFMESGHEVSQITDEITNKKITFADSAKLVSDELNSQPADCVFTINFFPSISEVCNIYHIRYISWIVDSPVLELFSSAITNPYNRVFLFDRVQYNEIAPLNPSCVFHYPLAVNVVNKQKVIGDALSKGGKELSGFSSDVSFVGSLYTEKSPFDKLSPNAPEYLKGFLEGLLEAQLKVYGYYFVPEILTDDVVQEFKKYMPDYYQYPFKTFITDKDIVSQHYIGNKITAMERCKMVETITEHRRLDLWTASDTSQLSCSNLINHGTCKTLTEMPIIFNQSKINLNPTSKAIRSGVPLRIFDVFACEGFVLSNYQIELAELFVPGEDFVYYDSVEAIPEVINYYLEHDNERREIAHNAYVKVRDNYSYMLRLNGLLLKAFSL